MIGSLEGDKLDELVELVRNKDYEITDIRVYGDRIEIDYNVISEDIADRKIIYFSGIKQKNKMKKYEKIELEETLYGIDIVLNDEVWESKIKNAGELISAWKDLICEILKKWYWMKEK